MEFLIIYGLVATIVALLSLVLIAMPVFDRLMADGVENSITENPTIFHLSIFIASLLFAPITAVLVFTSFSKLNLFRDKLFEELQKA